MKTTIDVPDKVLKKTMRHAKAFDLARGCDQAYGRVWKSKWRCARRTKADLTASETEFVMPGTGALIVECVKTKILMENSYGMDR